MGLIAGAASLAGGIYGLTQGAPASNVQLPQTFQMPNQGAAANNAFSGIGNLGSFDLYSPNIGTAQGITQGLVNNPYASGYQSGANVAGGLGQMQALGQYGAGQGLVGAGQNVINTAMDPQNQLYAYLQNQNSQQANAQNAMSGIGTTPYGAGVADQSNQLFNLNWQNQQLQRQIAGLGAGGQAIGQGEQLSSAAPGQYMTSGAAPYSAYNAIGGQQLGALGTLGQFGTAASGLSQQQIQDYLTYLGQGNQSNSVANQTAQLGLNQANLGFQQNQTYGNMIGGGLGSLGNLGWNSSSPSLYNSGPFASLTGPMNAQGLVNP